MRVHSGPRALFQDLANEIVLMANAVCTTPFVSSQDIYAIYNSEVAKASVLDDAGAMHTADAVTVWKADGRPVLMTGDPQQLPPTVMTMSETRNGKMANWYAHYARISILEQLQRSGYPIFVLRKQCRMVRSLFDVARVIYKDFKDDWYVAQCELVHHPIAAKIESWVKSEYNVPGASPQGAVLPVFFNVLGTDCQTTPGCTSKFNTGQIAFAVQLIDNHLGAMSGSGLRGKDVVVVTPFRDNRQWISEALQTHRNQELRNVSVNTVDSFRGREGTVALFVLCVTRDTGPESVANGNHLAVSLTRQTDALFLIGDIETGVQELKAGARKVQYVTGDDGAAVRRDRDDFKAVLEYFKKTNRIADVPVPEIAVLPPPPLPPSAPPQHQQQAIHSAQVAGRNSSGTRATEDKDSIVCRPTD